MNSRAVLVDSSAWINYWTGKKGGAWESLDKLLQDHRVATNEIIRLEILTGARDETQYAGLADQFEGLHFLTLSGIIWKHAERLRFDLRHKGCLIPTADALIASCAIVHGCELLHADRHFDQVNRQAPLKIFRP